MHDQRRSKRPGPISRFASVMMSCALVLNLVPAPALAQARMESEKYFGGSGSQTLTEGTQDTDTTSITGASEQQGTSGSSTVATGTVGKTQQGASQTTSTAANPKQDAVSAQTTVIPPVQLKDYLSEAVILGAESNYGWYTVEAGTEYDVRLTFAERVDKQFEDDRELDYTLPAGFVPTAAQHALDGPVTVRYMDERGQKLEFSIPQNTWKLEGNTLKFWWNQKQNSGFDYLASLANAEFELVVRGTFAVGTTSVDFGKGIVALEVRADASEQKTDEVSGPETNDGTDGQASSEDNQSDQLEDSQNDEQQRWEEEQARIRRELEEQEKREEEQRRIEEEQARLEEEQRQAEEEQARLEEEQRQAEEEQARLEEEQRIAEEEQARFEEEQRRLEESENVDNGDENQDAVNDGQDTDEGATDERQSTDTDVVTGDENPAPAPATTEPVTTESAATSEQAPETATEPQQARTVYEYEDDQVAVTATLMVPGAVPEDAELRVTPIRPYQQSFDTYIDALNAASDDTLYSDQNTILYDVAFVKDGAEFEPAEGSVQVQFRFKKYQLENEIGAQKTAAVEVNHLPEVNGAVEVEPVASQVSVQNEVANVTVDSFSVFSFSYTVDFTYGGYLYRMPGEGSVALSKLLLSLGITDGVGSVADVTFSNPSLVSVTRDFVGSDWRLVSHASFDTEETLTVQLHNGARYEIKVTDPAESQDLKDYLTDATIRAPIDDTGAYVLTPGSSYSIFLSFAEQPDGIQFPTGTRTMTYQIPEGVHLDLSGSNTFTINVTDAKGGSWPVEGNTYSVSGNTLTVTFNGSSPNIDKLDAAANARFNLSFNGTIDETVTRIPFSDTVQKDVKLDTSAKVTSSKSGYFDLANKKIHYTVTLMSTGKSTKVHVKDTVTDTQGIITSIDNLHYNSNTRGLDFTEGVSGSVSDKTYDYTFDTMANGEVISFTYDANIDPAKITPDPTTGKVTYPAQNEVEVTSENGPTPPKIENETVVDYTPRLTKDGVVSEDGKTITYTVTYNEGGKLSMAGKTLTDSIREDSRQYLTFGAQDVKVDVYDAATNTKIETRNHHISEGKSFDYTVPSGDGVYKYVLTFTADVTVPAGTHKPVDVYNDVEVPGNKTSTGDTVLPEEGLLTIDKEVQSVSEANKEVTWKTTITVPKNGLSSAVVTDTYPNTWLNNTHIFEKVKMGATSYSYATPSDSYITVTGLVPGEHVNVAYNDENAVFTFYKNDTDQGLNGGTDIRTITLTYRTALDDTWLANWDKVPGHSNTVRIEDQQDTATAYVIEDGVDKTGGLWGTRVVDGVELPIYQYVVELNNVTEDVNQIKDGFDTTILEPFDPSDPAVAGTFTKTSNDDHSWWAWRTTNDTYNSRSDEKVNYVSTSTGMTITTTEASMVHDTSSGTGFYPKTKIIYYLTVKDQTALVALQGKATKDGKFSIENNVTWKDKTGGTTVEYEYPALTKEILTSDADLSKTDQDIYGDFRITYNPAGVELHGGAPKDMTDTVENLSIDITSIQISPAGTGITYDMEGDKLTFKNVPDSTPITITYRARVKFDNIGNVGDTVTVNFKNTVKTEGYTDKVDKSAHRTNKGEGRAELYSVNLMKYEAGNMSKRLKGAKFQLFKGKPDASSEIGFVAGDPVLANGDPVTFTTDDNGLITVEGDQNRDGWTINANTYYFLKEIEAPTDYMLSSFDYAFRVSEDGTTDYSRYIYHSGDTLSAKNYLGRDLKIVKSWGDGNDAHAGDQVVVKLQQRDFTDDGSAAWHDYIIEEVPDGSSYKWQRTESKTLTLNKDNDWQGTFANLPIFVPVDITKSDSEDKRVEYQIKEVSINGIDADVTVEQDAKNGSNDFYTWTYQPHGNITSITNYPQSGSLKLKKRVTVNGAQTGSKLADGTYTFKVTGPQGSSSPVTKNVSFIITDGAVASITGDGTLGTDGYVEITGLSVGDYTIEETGSTNSAATLTSVTGGKSVTNNIATVTVESGKTGTAVIATGKADFTNNVGVGSIKLKKNVTVNGVPAVDTEAFGTKTAADGEYIFQVWKGEYNSTEKPLARVKITITNGVAVSAQYELIAERTQGSDGKEVIHWHEATVNDDYTVQINDLAPGLYTVHELESEKYLPEGMSLVGGKAQGGNNVQVTVTPNNTTTIPTASFTNDKSESGDLTLSKVLISSNPADSSVNFNFQIVLSDTSISGSYGGITFENGRASVRLTGGNSVTATGLPTGVTYTITELSATGFSLTGITVDSADQTSAGKATGIITGTPSSVEFKNKREEGGLRVTKIVNSNFASDRTNKKFSFTVTLTNSTLSGTFGTGATAMTFNNGVATFELAHNQSREATGLPANLPYTVTETDEAGFTTTWEGKTGTIPENDIKYVTATNDRNYGNLEIDKTVVSNTGTDQQKNFNFTVTLTDKNINGTFGTSTDPNTKVLTFTDGSADVSLKHGQKAIAQGLPEGVNYTVTEAETEGFATGATGETGKISSSTLSKAEFTNTRVEGGLVLMKRVTSASKADEGKYFTFKVYLLNSAGQTDTTINDTHGDLVFRSGVATVLLRHGQQVAGSGIAAGTKYRVEEVDTTADTVAEAGMTEEQVPESLYGKVSDFTTTIYDGYKQTTTSGTIIASEVQDVATSLRFNNSRVNGRLTVKKELVSKAAADANQQFTFTVKLYTAYTSPTENTPDTSINGTYGGMTFRDGVATVNIKGGASVSAENLPAGLYYTVEEASVDGFTLVDTTDEEGQVTTSGVTAILKNERNDTELPIHKSVVSDLAQDASRVFDFTVTFTGLTDEAANGTYDVVYDPRRTDESGATVTLTNGVGELQLHSNETATIKGLPEGVSYSVTEDINANYVNTDIDHDKGVLSQDTPTVEFENQRAFGEISISKELAFFTYGLSSDTDKEFTFTVELDGLTPGDKTYGGVTYAYEDGAHKTTFTIKPYETKVLKGIPRGTHYQINETETAEGFAFYGYEGDGIVGIIDNVSKKTYVKNLHIPADLTVSKELVSDAPADANQQFTFDVAFDDLDEAGMDGTFDVEYVPAKSGDTGKLKLNGGKGQITLKGGQKAKIKNLPNGVTYTVTERSLAGFALVGETGNTQTRTAQLPMSGATEIFKNQRVTGGFSLKKLVTATTAADKDRQFKFSVRLTGTTVTTPADNPTKYGNIQFKDGVAIVMLKDGESAYAENLPVGIGYTISEALDSDYTTTVSGVDSSQVETTDTSVVAKGTITEETNQTHTYPGPTFNNTKTEGSLSVNKTVTSNYAPDFTREFTFKVVLGDKSINNKETGGAYPYPVIATAHKPIPFENGEATFTLKHGETASIKGLPAGVSYTVTETAVDGFATTWEGNTSSTIRSGASQNITARNRRLPGELDITKTVVGGTASDLNFYFRIKVSFFTDEAMKQPATDANGRIIMVNSEGQQTFAPANFTGGTASFGLLHSDTAKIMDVPLGLYYKVEEETPDGFKLVATGDTGQVATQSIARLQNRRDQGGLYVTKHVRSTDPADKTKAYDFKVTLFEDEALQTVDEDINAKYGSMTFDKGEATFQLKDGEVAYASNLPLAGNGLWYKVEEKTPAGFKVYVGVVDNVEVAAEVSGEYSYTDGHIEDGKTVNVDIINSRTGGNLEVVKSNDSTADTDQEFSFTVTLDDKSINGKYGEMTFADGVATFTLKKGETKTTADTTKQPDDAAYYTLPVGVGYTVTETHADGYKTTWSNKTGSGQAEKTYTYDHNITTAEEDGMISPTSETRTLTDGTDTFTVTRDVEPVIGEDESVSYATWDKDDATTNFIKSDGTKAYEPTISSETTDNVTFTNTRELGGFRVNKALESNLREDDEKTFHFFVELDDKTITGKYGDGDKAMEFNKGLAEFDIKAGDYRYATGLPKGLGYTVVEGEDTNFIQSDANARGFVGYGLAGEVELVEDAYKDAKDVRTHTTYTNKHREGMLELEKNVISEIKADKERDYEFKVTLGSENAHIGEKVGNDYVFTLYRVHEDADHNTYVDEQDPLTFTNGEATLTLTDGEKAIIGMSYVDAMTVEYKENVKIYTVKDDRAIGIPAGIAYKVEETAVEGLVASWTGETGTIPTEAAAQVTCTNTHTDGTLSVSKTIISDAASDKNASFDFTVTLWEDQGHSKRADVDGTYGTGTTAMTFTNGVATVTVKGGSAAVATGLPAGLFYTVEETSVPGFRLVQGKTSGTEGTIEKTSQAEARFTNERIPGKLILSKELVSDAAADANTEFRFTVTLTDKTISKTYAKVTDTDKDIQFANGVATVRLKGGEVASADGIPTGVGYTVTEAAATGFKVEKEGDSGKISETPSNVTFKNTRDVGELTISKRLAGEFTDADKNKEFTFTVVLSDKTITTTQEKTYGDIEFDGGKATVELKADQSATATNLPTGIRYTITEVNTPGFALNSVTGDQGVISTTKSTAVFTNIKHDRPSFDKKIKDKNDSTGEESNWQDSADYDIGDEVPYRLTATLASDVSAYKKYHITFVDEMEPSLTFKQIQRVTVNGDPVSNYTLTPDSVKKDQRFELTLNWGDGTNRIGDESLNHAVVEVYFTATLNENAKLGKPGNINACKLKFSNNPDSEDDSEEELPWDYVIAFTYKVNINKIDQARDPLTGAVFTLEKYDKATESYKAVADAKVTQNVFSFVGLDDGNYRLTETTVPEGHLGVDPIEFTVAATHNAVWNNPSADTAEVPNFADNSRNGILTALTGDVTTGALTLETDTDLATLTGDVQNDKPTKAPIEVTKAFQNAWDSWGNAKSFSFTLTSVDGAPMPDEAKGETTLTKTVVLPEQIESLDPIKATFGDVTYNEEGTFKYTIAEVLPAGVDAEHPTKDGVTYDTTTYDVTVKVTRNLIDAPDDPGALKAVVTYDQDEPELKITNKYAATGKGTVEVEKVISNGRAWGDEESFTFHLYAGTEDDYEERGELIDTVTITKVDAGHKKSFGEITFTKPGTYNYVVVEEEGDIPDINYYWFPKEVTFEVVDNGDGTLSTDVEGGLAQVQVVNEAMKGSLRLRKTVAGIKLTDEQRSLITFTVTNADKETVATLNLLDHFEESNASNDTTEYDLKDEFVPQLALGTYTVVETNEITGYIDTRTYVVDGKETTDKAEVEIHDGVPSDVIINDGIYPSSLTISKEILVNDGKDHSDDTFTFIVTITPPAGSQAITGTHGDMDFDGGVATVTLKGGKSAKATEIPVGSTYTVTEENAVGYVLTGIINKDGETDLAKAVATGTISATEAKDYEVKFTNTKLGRLEVTKAVKGLPDGLASSKEFSFTVSREVGGKTVYYKRDGSTADKADDAAITIHDGETVTIENLPADTYDVQELADGTQVEGYFLDPVAAQGVTVSVGGTATATITNAYTPTSLTLSKKVVVPEGEDVPADTFTFTVTLTPPDGHAAVNGTYGGMDFTDNVATVSLRGGQSATATAIPAGTSYVITEASHPGFELTGVTSDGSAVSGKQATGTFTDERGDSHTAEFRNARLGGLEVTKAVTGLPEGLRSSKTFSFTVSQTKDGKTTYFLPDGTTTENVDDAAVTIRNGQVVSFAGLASGTYVVTELGIGESGSAQVDGYHLTASGSGNVAVSAGTTRRATLSNTYAKVGLTVAKMIEVTDGADHTEDEFTFTVTLTPPEGTEAISGTYGDMTFKDNVATLTLKGGASATATGLPVGTKYVVTEAAHDGFTLTGIAVPDTDKTITVKDGTASGTITAHDSHSMTFNNKTVRGKLVVRKVVYGVYTAKKFSFVVYQSSNGTVTYFKQNGTATSNINEATYSIGDGESITFEDLAPGIYAVEEFTDGAQIDGYYLVASGSGDVSVSNGQTTTATLTNSYVGENYGGLRVYKTVYSSSSSDHNKQFTFRITLSDRSINGTYGYGTYGDYYDYYGTSYNNLYNSLYDTYNNVYNNLYGYNSRYGYGNSYNSRYGYNNNYYSRNYGATYSMHFVNGVATVHLADGESAYAYGLPAGISYTVTEEEDGRDGFTTTKTGSTGIITGYGINTAHFHNSKYNDDEVSVNLTANKRLTGRTLTAGEFSFQLKDSSGKVLQTKTNSASGAINFDEIKYDDTGTYTYTISEVKGNDSTVTYDTHEAKVTVKVEEDSNGKLKATTTYDSNNEATFNNTATPTNTPTPVTPVTPTTTPTSTLPANTSVLPANTSVVPASTVAGAASATPTTSDATLLFAVPALLATGGAGLGAGALRRRRKNK